ncbi:hypothetical protein ABPG72_015674 [Tetrahymena utriculariae]
MDLKDQSIDQQLIDSLKNRKFKIASRSSQLALSQTYEVIDLLVAVKELGLTKENFEVVPISNAPGDQNLKDPLYVMGGVGVFTKIVEVELLNKNGDIAVHSLKDLPTIIDERLFIGAVPPLKPRGDVVIFNEKHKGKELKDLPEGSVVGTSSLRRITNLKHRYPHLKYENIRGNLNTRLTKLEKGQYDAIILAEAGVFRLGWIEKVGQFFKQEDFLYAPGQGALGVQCRADDKEAIALLSYINQKEPRIRVDAERQFLNKLEGGCKLPIAVHSEIIDQTLRLTGQVWSLEADKTIREVIEGHISDQDLGLKLCDKMKIAGACEILEKIRSQIDKKEKEE